jgi:hypothetical protein
MIIKSLGKMPTQNNQPNHLRLKIEKNIKHFTGLLKRTNQVSEKKLILEEISRLKKELKNCECDSQKKIVKEDATDTTRTAKFAGNVAAPSKLNVNGYTPIVNTAKLTHKAFCPKCQKDNFIDWFTYPNEKRKQLGCVECQTKIDIYKAYKLEVKV